VIEDAFSACAEFHKMGHDIKISINLSMKDLLNPELPDLVAGLTAKIGIDPSWVIFEITEGSIMTDPTRALIIVERLKSMGFDFSIDDFGTGYSSMAYLKRLPVSELKIDKSFVLDMMTNENDAIIVQATIGLAHNLGLTVTAEGVEDEKALQMLDKMGCDIAQGYFFSRPLPKTELLSWMQKNSLSS
jgi:EAL domain-containing protein (putative c-di-GMP-specific phosphodiesterase class I)